MLLQSSWGLLGEAAHAADLVGTQEFQGRLSVSTTKSLFWQGWDTWTYVAFRASADQNMYSLPVLLEEWILFNISDSNKHLVMLYEAEQQAKCHRNLST